MLLCRTTLPYKEPIKNIFSVCDTEEVADKFQKAFSLLGGEDMERVHMQSDRAESQVMGQGLLSREKFPLLSECALSECLLWINVPLKWHFRKYKSKYRSRLTDRYLTDCIGLAVCTYEPNYMALRQCWVTWLLMAWWWYTELNYPDIRCTDWELCQCCVPLSSYNVESILQHCELVV